MYCRPAPMSLSSAYTCASSLIASLTRRMSCNWLPGWQCTSCRQSSMSCCFSTLNSSRISVMNRPNLDFSPAEERSEEHTSELQSPYDLVCRLLLEKKKKKNKNNT